MTHKTLKSTVRPLTSGFVDAIGLDDDSIPVTPLYLSLPKKGGQKDACGHIEREPGRASGQSRRTKRIV